MNRKGKKDIANNVTQGPNLMSALWTVRDVARFLRKSCRWIWYALQVPPSEPGSIPHVRLGRSPRFLPELIVRWVQDGCPPVATFEAWIIRKKRKG